MKNVIYSIWTAKPGHNGNFCLTHRLLFCQTYFARKYVDTGHLINFGLRVLDCRRPCFGPIHRRFCFESALGGVLHRTPCADSQYRDYVSSKFNAPFSAPDLNEMFIQESGFNDHFDCEVFGHHILDYVECAAEPGRHPNHLYQWQRLSFCIIQPGKVPLCSDIRFPS